MKDIATGILGAAVTLSGWAALMAANDWTITLGGAIGLLLLSGGAAILGGFAAVGLYDRIADGG